QRRSAGHVESRLQGAANGASILVVDVLRLVKGGYRMATTEHVDSLKAKHADLDRLIAEEEGRPHPDDARITELKRQKLRIKDEIVQLIPH
ncbi:MAG: YdcH family protein, partial [Reyranella sp.]